MILHLRTTKKCNMNCNNCHSPQNKEKDISFDKISDIEKFLKKYILYVKNFEKKLDISYIGGEVTLNKEISEFKKIDEYFKIKGWGVVSGIQTNLIMPEKKLDDLEKEYKNRYSTSYNFFNERKYKNSYKEFKKEFKKNYLYIYKKYNSLPAIVVLITNKNVKQMYKIFTIFNKYGINITFTYFKPLGNGQKNFNLIPNQLIYREQLIKIEKHKNKNITVEPLLTMKKLINEELTSACSFQRDCYKHEVSIENDNTCYQCSEMAELKLLPTSKDLKTLEIENLEKLTSRIDNLPEKCYNCNVFKYCQSGCMVDSYLIYNSLYKETYMCESWYKVFNYLKNNK